MPRDACRTAGDAWLLRDVIKDRGTEDRKARRKKHDEESDVPRILSVQGR